MIGEFLGFLLCPQPTKLLRTFIEIKRCKEPHAFLNFSKIVKRTVLCPAGRKRMARGLSPLTHPDGFGRGYFSFVETGKSRALSEASPAKSELPANLGTQDSQLRP